MLVEIDPKIQIKLVYDSIKKAGSERKLEKLIKIPDICIHQYKKMNSRMPYNRFKVFLKFLGLNEVDFNYKLIEHNYFRKKGGLAVQKKYLKENRLDEILKNARSYIINKDQLKHWHAKMKKEKPEEYFEIQHRRFKKINKKKWKTNRGEFVRNKFELEIANILDSLSADYLYEPCMKLSSTYFPDFKVGNLIIECTAWRGEDKAKALSIKIQDFEKEGYKVKVVVPDNLRSFYKCHIF